ncbi:hypothetical protein [Bacillus solimangrovi]|uniref:Uncharacterized protein n=1 Tax=Bacillus solimangrovi TaxID=1305675 RepID=A0A1E5LAD3_9BACI|nr:hypothetical protein [Bacillus solimangrovi]OEH91062.1 hypothetical protein BFG57_06730 [Bacillus solimangrovi]
MNLSIKDITTNREQLQIQDDMEIIQVDESNEANEELINEQINYIANTPIEIEFPQKKRKAPIQAVGLTKNGNMSVADDAIVVGWYKTAAKNTYLNYCK